MTPPVFMSPEHVKQINEILAADEAVRTACAGLERPLTMGYALSDGPDGATVYWAMTFTDTVRFSLDQVDADLLFTGDWARMVRASRANREGRTTDPGVLPVGDLELIKVIGPVFAVATTSTAGLPVSFPDI